MENTLYYGDNLDILRKHIPDESIDLVYLDPPFKSSQNYNILFKEQNGSRAASQIRAFEDTWTWSQEDEAIYADLVTKGGKVADCLQAFRTFLGPCDMLAYLVMMAPRLVALRRVMKQTGSIYLHCDPAASHYLKMLMDAVFRPENFLNEIIWRRTTSHSDAQRCGNVHDVILYFSKGDNPCWNRVTQPFSEEYIEQYYRYKEPDGRRFMSGDLTGAGPGPTRHFGEHGELAPGEGRHWMYDQNGIDRCLKENRIFWTRNGIPRLKKYLDESDGMPINDIWTDILPLRSWHKERLGYPTQKPEALIERILQASSKEGDIVLDPFCGCGTTIAAAQKLGRRWIGIDITYLAIILMKNRLADHFGDQAKYQIVGEPVSLPDAQALAESEPYQFQWWALDLVGARPAEQKKGADKGIDGKIIFQGDAPGKFEQVIISVKAGHVTANHVRDLRGVVEREKAAIGVLISMEDPTKPMQTEAVTAGFFESKTWGKKYPKVQLLTIAELLAGKKIEMPPIKQVGATFKKAEKFKGDKSEQLALMKDKD